MPKPPPRQQRLKEELDRPDEGDNRLGYTLRQIDENAGAARVSVDLLLVE